MQVYMSVEDGFQDTPAHLYRSSKKILDRLSDLVDLRVVKPGDYIPGTTAMEGAFRYTGAGSSLVRSMSRHEPRGDLFIIYGDESSKSLGIDFARREYAFLKGLERSGSFRHFLNNPRAEEQTLKDGLIALSAHEELPIAKTFRYESDGQIRMMLERYPFLVLKPIFGCRGAGVRKIGSLEELLSICGPEALKKEYVLQEPLEGSETRVILLDGEYLGSREDINTRPWGDSREFRVAVGDPTKEQIEQSKRVASLIGADLIGVDFIGDRIYEINGTGTGLIAYDTQGRLLFDHTDAFVDRVMRTLAR